MKPFLLVPIFFILEQCCNAVLMWNFKNVWTKKCHFPPAWGQVDANYIFIFSESFIQTSLSKLLPSISVSCLGEPLGNAHPTQVSSAVPLGRGTVYDCVPSKSDSVQSERLTALARDVQDEGRAGCSQTLPLFSWPLTLLDLKLLL